MSTSVILSGARTPIGKLLGSLKDLTAVQLGATAISAALERSGVEPDRVQYTIMGQVLGAGAGQNPARQAAVAAGIPMHVPAMTINRVCLSGLDAVALADQWIRAGEYDLVVAGGQESMTNAPHLVPGARAGFKAGPASFVDSMQSDGLFCAFDDMLMGRATDRANHKYGLTRGAQDEFAAGSHRKAAAAIEAGLLAEEIVPVRAPHGKNGTTLVTRDESVRPATTLEVLAALPPSFDATGTITAATASPLNDGAAALVVCRKELAEDLGLPWLAEIGAYATVAGPDAGLHEQPARAISAALEREKLTVADLDLVEINEAFAAVPLVSTRQLGIDPDLVNAEGGALALGHPLGASGARLVLHLAHALRRGGGGTGIAALCGGGGQGTALILRSPRGD